MSREYVSSIDAACPFPTAPTRRNPLVQAESDDPAGETPVRDGDAQGFQVTLVVACQSRGLVARCRTRGQTKGEHLVELDEAHVVPAVLVTGAVEAQDEVASHDGVRSVGIHGHFTAGLVGSFGSRNSISYTG